MELALSPEDAAFRDEVRAFISGQLPAEMRVPNPETDLSQGADAAVASHPAQEGLDRAALAEGVRWTGLVDHPPLHLRAGDHARRHNAAAGVQRHHGRSGDLYVRQRRAEEEVPAADPVGRGLVVPGLFRAGLGLRSRHRPHQGGARRRPLHRQRPQDLDHAGAARRLDFLPGPHRSHG